MACEWRRAVFAALAAAMIGGACALSAQFGTLAYAADEAAEEEQEQAPASDAQPKGGKKRQDPAEAQRAIEAALKQVQAGRTEQAVQTLTSTLSAGNLPPPLMAKALHVRGLAYRKQGRSAQAISDFNSALWLKGGLGGEDRIEATNERSAAYADAGLGGRGDESEGPAPKAASGGFLSGLFGSPKPSAQPPARELAPPPAPASVEAPPPAKSTATVSSSWSSKTEVQKAAATAVPPPKAVRPAAPPARSKEARPPATAKSPPADGIEGKYLVQLAATRTEAEAQALVAKAKSDPALAKRRVAIDRAVLGEKGAFYRVRFGPFASAQETQAVCAKLRGSGFECLPVGR
jgi:cell division septation protein DedD